MQEKRESRISKNLNALLEDLAAVREEHAICEILTPEVIKCFGSSVQAMRRLLCLYIEEASRQSNLTVPNQTLRDAIDALKSMRDTTSTTPDPWADGTLIEKVEAIVRRKIPTLDKG